MLDRGNKVKLKGRDPQGVIYSKNGSWVVVRWDKDKLGPAIVHELELENI